MNIDLTEQEKEQLELRHKTERDRRVADRIKAVLLNSEGWSQKQISQALRIRYETVKGHLVDYKENKKLKPENGGSKSQLLKEQAAELVAHIAENTYLKAELIRDYISHKYSVTMTLSGITKWLERNGFSYKKPKGTPAKADSALQDEFVKRYQDLLNETQDDEPIEFLDAVHPTMATKITYGWIRTGQDKQIETTASRTRMNLLGSINLETMSVTIESHETINSQSLSRHFEALQQKYPKAPTIHLITDRGAYNTSKETKAAAEQYGITLHHLPPYSPNLNPIERLWKVMNEYARNNQVFKTAKEFRQAIMCFFNTTWPKIAQNMVDRINDNFQNVDKYPQVSGRTCAEVT
jgi:transposase